MIAERHKRKPPIAHSSRVNHSNTIARNASSRNPITVPTTRHSIFKLSSIRADRAATQGEFFGAPKFTHTFHMVRRVHGE